MRKSLEAVVIYGPPGCGKSAHAPELLQRFGCTSIVDEWDGEMLLQPGQLALTNKAPPYSVAGCLAVPFREAG